MKGNSLYPAFFRVFALAFLALALVLPPLATDTHAQEINGLSLSQRAEIKKGKEMHAEIMQKMPIYRDPELQEYVSAIGQRVAAVSDRKGIEYTFTIIDSPDINAFALPGGYIYINRGLLTYLNSEAELAAVLGHEVGHVAARHIAQQNTANNLSKILSTVLAVGTQIAVGAGGAEIGELSNIAGTAIVSGYGREHELEADRLGALYLYQTNYDPKAMETVIGVLKDQERFAKLRSKDEGRKPQTYHGLFASHPRNDTRLQQVVAAAGQLPAGQAIDNRDVFREKTRGLEFGGSSQGGTLRESRFYHKLMDFTLAFPSQWQVQNSPNAVVAFPNAQDAFIQLQARGGIDKLKPEEFIVKRLEIDNLTEGEPLDQYGLQGYTGLVPASDSRGPVRIAVIYHRGQAFYFTGVNRRPDAALNYDPFFKATIASFRPMQAEDFRAASDLKLSYIIANTGTTYAELAKSSPIPDYAEEQLRLLNGHYPNGEPAPGSWIKIVER